MDTGVAKATVRCATGCGQVQVPMGDVTVAVLDGNTSGWYAFRCPDCGLVTSHYVSGRTLGLIASGGAHLTVLAVPAELGEHESFTGDALSADNLLEWGLFLQRVDLAGEVARL